MIVAERAAALDLLRQFASVQAGRVHDRVQQRRANVQPIHEPLHAREPLPRLLRHLTASPQRALHQPAQLAIEHLLNPRIEIRQHLIGAFLCQIASGHSLIHPVGDCRADLGGDVVQTAAVRRDHVGERLPAKLLQQVGGLDAEVVGDDVEQIAQQPVISKAPHHAIETAAGQIALHLRRLRLRRRVLRADDANDQQPNYQREYQQTDFLEVHVYTSFRKTTPLSCPRNVIKVCCRLSQLLNFGKIAGL